MRILCQQGKISGVIRKGRAWLIPADAEKSIDGRTTRYQRNDSSYAELFAEIDALNTRDRTFTSEISAMLGTHIKTPTRKMGVFQYPCNYKDYSGFILL